MAQSPCKTLGNVVTPSASFAVVTRRSGGVCESCGDRPASTIRHRQTPRNGGPNEPHNLVHLCTTCDKRAAHAYDEGLTIPPTHRTVITPLLYRGVWVLPDDHGGLQRLGESTAEFLLSNGGRT